MKKISVIIPVYNVSEYINRCIQSIKEQTYKGPIECIFVDDCSPDNSNQLIENSFKECPHNIKRQIIHHSENRGLSAARNTGIANATGDYIYFLDSDDTITPDCLDFLSCYIQGENYDFVSADFKVNASYEALYAINHYNGKIIGNENILNLYIKHSWHVMACNKLCSTQFIKRNKLIFQEGLLHEDVLWSFRLACSAQSAYIINKKTYNYIIRENSIITQPGNERKHFKAYLEIITQIIQICNDDKNINPFGYRYLLNLSNSVLYSTLKSKSISYRESYKSIRNLMSNLNILRFLSKDEISLKQFILCVHFNCPFYIGLTISYIISVFKNKKNNL